jgi:hypothetical protein
MKNLFDENNEIAEQLKREPLFQEKLLPDLNNGCLLPIIRNSKICFCCKDISLFVYTKSGFMLSAKHLAWLISDGIGWVDAKKLKEKFDGLAEDLGSLYDRIKRLCNIGVDEYNKNIAELYQFSGGCSAADTVLLDVCVDFADLTKDYARRGKEITACFLNKKTKELRFYKVITARQIEAQENYAEEICARILKDKEQITRTSSRILNWYKKDIELLNVIFDAKIPIFKKVREEIILLGIGFNLRQEKQLKLLKDKCERLNIEYCFIKNPKDICRIWA